VATGQAATCWVVRNGSTFYASNSGSANLSGFTVNRAGTLSALGLTMTGAGPVDAAASANGKYLYLQTGAAGNVDEFRIAADGSLTQLTTITVPGAAGGEGIVAS
jgi:6-phosphogluconolactonase (cycloisomerase 2 family)